MNASLPSRRRLLHPIATFAAFAVVIALAPKAHADDGGGALRNFWGALWAWLTPPAVSAAALRPEAARREAGAMIDPSGGTTALAPPAVAPAGNTGADEMSDPSG